MAAFLLGASPEVPLGGQFHPHALESLFDNLLLAVRAPNRLIPGEPLMGQLGLEVVDRRLSVLEQMFRTLWCDSLLPQSLPRCVELVGVGTVILIPADDRDRNLAIAEETPMFSRAIKIACCWGQSLARNASTSSRKCDW
jgi:hypothetical protein